MISLDLGETMSWSPARCALSQPIRLPHQGHGKPKKSYTSPRRQGFKIAKFSRQVSNLLVGVLNIADWAPCQLPRGGVVNLSVERVMSSLKTR